MTFSVQPTRKTSPIVMLVHADGGVGKSTFAAAAPGTIFIAAEDGLKNIDARAVDPHPTSWSGVLEALDYLADAGECRTVAVDSLDWIEPLCWEHVCKASRKKDIEAFGYGKGYVAALDEWRIFLRKLEVLRGRGKNIILVAHSIRKPVKNPEGDDYERWQIKLHEKAAGLIKEWVDIVAFASHEVLVDDSSGRAKGMSTGRRLLRVQPNAAYDAKTRYDMPKSIPLDWAAFERAVEAGRRSPVERLKADLDVKLVELADDAVESKAMAFLKERGTSVSSLTEALDTVTAYLAEKRKAG